MWNLLKIENCQILIFWYITVFVKCNPYSGLVIIDNNFLSLCISESGFSEAVFAGLISLGSVSKKIDVFSLKKMKIFDLSLYFYAFLLGITDSQRN